MVESLTTLHPLVEWAQRETYLYLTVEVDDVAHLQISDKALHVKGRFGSDKTMYEAKLDFYNDVKTDYRKIDNNRHLELVITKKEPGWWPRLLKNAAKLPWVKVDFNKWKDEDEEVEDVHDGAVDFENYMSNLGGGGAPDLDDMDDDSRDDNEDDPRDRLNNRLFLREPDMPDLESLDEDTTAGSGSKEEEKTVKDSISNKTDGSGGGDDELAQQS